MLTETVIEDDRWCAIDLATLAETAARATLRQLGLGPEGFEIVVLGCDDARIAVLNGDFRGRPAATNVLSWPAADLSAEAEGAAPEAPEPGTHDDPESLGDIAIALETCAREAEAAGRPLADHVAHLIVHGVLHLLGHDHVRDADATLMEGLEAAILGKMGIDDPYRVL